MNLKDWQLSGKNFKFKEYQIFYRDSQTSGDGLLLIHGFPTASRDWYKMWPVLEVKFRLIAHDMLGFGFSDKPQDITYSIMEQANIIEELLKEINIENIHILAHDYGDTVAQELLARFIERKNRGVNGLKLKSICFLNGGLFPEAHNPRLIQKLLISPIGKYLSFFMNKNTLKRNFNQIFGKWTKPSDQEIDEFWDLIQYNNGISIFYKLIRYMAERKKFRERWVSALQNSTIPLRLIDGTADPIAGKNIADRYKELVPNPDIILLENIGHYPNIEASDLVLKYYIEFYENNFS
jgi:pimeloyl-ACP methyl ester carboxylesterase